MKSGTTMKPIYFKARFSGDGFDKCITGVKLITDDETGFTDHQLLAINLKDEINDFMKQNTVKEITLFTTDAGH